MSRQTRDSPEVRCAVPCGGCSSTGASTHQVCAAIGSISTKIGRTAETLRSWVRQAERDQGVRAGPTSEERERLEALEREVRELRQANATLRKASAYFAMAEPRTQDWRRSKP